MAPKRAAWDGFLAGLDGGGAHGLARVGKFVAVGVGAEDAGRYRAEIMERLDLDQVFLPSLDDARPERKADGVAELADGKSELPDFLEHRVTILMPIGIPAGGEGEWQHGLQPAYHI